MIEIKFYYIINKLNIVYQKINLVILKINQWVVFLLSPQTIVKRRLITQIRNLINNNKIINKITITIIIKNLSKSNTMMEK